MTGDLFGERGSAAGGTFQVVVPTGRLDATVAALSACGLVSLSVSAERSIVAIATLVAAHRRTLLASPKAGPASYRLFEMLPMMPRFTIERVRQSLVTSFPTANAAVQLLEELGMVTELTGQKKNRIYSYAAYIDLLTR